MRLILVSDVFGLTPALFDLSKELGGCSIIDPYKGQMMAFKNESEAYSYFIENIGISYYSSFLANAIDSMTEEVILIGFSVGASAIWKLSEKVNNTLIKQAVCFYGSQIRNFTHIEPHFNIHLIFPSSEPHFDVLALQEQLANKVNVKANKVEYFHGFMNYYSKNYSEAGYKAHLNLLHSITR